MSSSLLGVPRSFWGHNLEYPASIFLAAARKFGKLNPASATARKFGKFNPSLSSDEAVLLLLNTVSMRY